VHAAAIDAVERQRSVRRTFMIARRPEESLEETPRARDRRRRATELV